MKNVKCMVRVNVGGVWFGKLCSTASETYEAVKGCCFGNKIWLGITNDESKNKQLSEYLFVVSKIFNGSTLGFSNHIFELTRIDDSTDTAPDAEIGGKHNG